MGQKVHIILEYDEETRSGICKGCGPVRISRKSGRWICNVSKRKWQSTATSSRRRYIKYKKDYCENALCTATIEDSCQLQIDHVDGNRYNNDPSNLKTLCANCHALKTKREKNHTTKYVKAEPMLATV